ncbi:MAG: hypothetical protein KJZ77_17590 [Anaerolineales bacterium]|nr:hypothetical protein [Anaerolineales bacterium]
MKRNLLFVLIFTLAACAPVQEPPPATIDSMDTAPLPAPTEADAPAQTVPTSPAESSEAAPDMFALLPAPVCNGTLTAPQMEGPYYTPDTPERNSLLEEGVEGERLLLIGYVLDVNCQPVPNAWLDFWQTDGNGVYDNAGYIFRGHQYTDGQGRYYLETVVPGAYSSRPIRHIHVKVQAPNGPVLTSQLYFPDQPVDGLTVPLTPQDGYQLGVFNFVVEK